MQILIGNGDGSFEDGSICNEPCNGSNGNGPSYLNGAGLDAAGLAVGDFNGDGKADLAVSDLMNHTITILTGNGDGTFTVGTPISTGMPAGSGAYQGQVVAADFNGDGKTDVAVVIEGKTTSDPSLSLLLGNGDGTFGAPSTFTATPADSFYDQAVAVGDFFGTGRSAIALLTGVSPSYVTILQDVSGLTPVKNLPTITWATPAAITNPTPLSATQLNATASVPGTFVYTPAPGTALAAGRQTLSVTFTPTDTVDYSPAEAMVTLTVNPAASPATYTLTTSTKSVEGSVCIWLRLVSTNYAGTVSFITTVTSTNGSASNVSASVPSVTLISGGGEQHLADNHRKRERRKPRSWGSVEMRRCGSTRCSSSRRTVHPSPKAGSGCPAGGWGTYASWLLDGLQLGPRSQGAADLYRHRDSHGHWHGDKPSASDCDGHRPVGKCFEKQGLCPTRV